jgi:hypothetical protein
MNQPAPRIAIEDIADLSEPTYPFGLGAGDAMDVSLMDVIIAIVTG